MAEITASLVKELREKTGAGMMDCKKALGETAGDIEAAIDWLRTKGLAAAAKKAGRVAAEGLVALATAHPAKFPDAVEQATGQRPALPDHLSDLFERKERFEVIANDAEQLKTYVAGFAGRSKA